MKCLDDSFVFRATVQASEAVANFAKSVNNDSKFFKVC